MSLSRIIHHSHSFIRLEIYHHIYVNVSIVSSVSVVSSVWYLNKRKKITIIIFFKVSIYNYQPTLSLARGTN